MPIIWEMEQKEKRVLLNFFPLFDFSKSFIIPYKKLQTQFQIT